MITLKNMNKQNISQRFRLKNIDEERDCFTEEIKQNELTGKRHKKVCTNLNYMKHLLILASTVTGCVSVYDFVSSVGFSEGITSSTVVGSQLLKVSEKSIVINQ